MRVLGINAVFHDSAACLVIDGKIVAAAEEERFSRRKHGKPSVPFATWELPVLSARWCLEHAGIQPEDLDAVAYSYDPSIGSCSTHDVTAEAWEGLRTLYVQRAPLFLRTELPGLNPACVRFVPHHLAHAASAYLAAPFEECSVMVLDGRGERSSYLAGSFDGEQFDELVAQQLPDSLGLLYEDVTEHLGFRRSSDEYKVMALASYGEPVHLEALRESVFVDGRGGFRTEHLTWEIFAKRRPAGDVLHEDHANLAASVQRLLEETLLDLTVWLHERTGQRALAMAGGVALNCVANSFLHRRSAFDEVWVQPAAGDAGTALGAALYIAAEGGDHIIPMQTAALGRSWSDEEIEAALDRARVPYERGNVTSEVAEAIAGNAVVAWFQGRSEWGPRALGHRSLLTNATRRENLSKLNDIKGREQFRPVAPMVLAERAHEIFEGPLPSPYMLFTHKVRREWRRRIPAVTHIDGSARIQTVDRRQEPLVAAMLDEVDLRTGLPLVVNTSLNTGGRPIVDSPRDALECFGSSPIDLLAIGSFLVRRKAL